MHVYFSVDQRLHGVGPVKYAWDPTGNFLASTGSSRVVHIFDRRGELVDQIVPPSPSICTHVVWSNSRDHKVHGLTLAVTQANSSVLVLWSASTQTTQHVDVGVKEITLLLWNKGKSTTMEGGEDNSVLLAIGTSKGQVVFYDMDDLAARAPSQQRVNVRTALSKHKKKILCGDWNSQNEFAFGSEDRQVSICYGKDGSVVDQVKIKAAPVGIQFGGRQSSGVKRIVSVNMGRETILLYDLNEKDNALELAFQARYGDIVDYRWFGAGYIIAGFSVGYVVVISTRKFCRKRGEMDFVASMGRHERDRARAVLRQVPRQLVARNLLQRNQRHGRNVRGRMHQGRAHGRLEGNCGGEFTSRRGSI
ncbi:hypothetical protein, variant 3, partial [Aphanomyces invadans]